MLENHCLKTNTNQCYHKVKPDKQDPLTAISPAPNVLEDTGRKLNVRKTP